MPLAPGSSRQVISNNISELHSGKTFAHTADKFGKDRANKQAVAIALHSAREHADGGGVEHLGVDGQPKSSFPLHAKVNADGLLPEPWPGNNVNERDADKSYQRGTVAGFDTGGAASDPVTAVISALQQGAATGSTQAPVPGIANTAAPSSSAATAQTSAATGVVPTAVPGTTMAAIASPASATVNPAAATMATKALETGGVANRAYGGFNMTKAPDLNPSWQERQEARGMHIGPVMSAVPGRTDNHPVKVPAGSYVFPAAHVASMGEGNTNAGLSLASRMFGGPYGTSAMKMGGGHSMMPHPPKPFTGFADGGYSEGGMRGAGHSEPVPVNISGGEFVIPPWEIVKKFGSLKRGHQILDHWVMHRRGKEIKTQKNLPPPATK